MGKIAQQTIQQATIKSPSNALIMLCDLMTQSQSNDSEYIHSANPITCQIHARNDYEAMLSWLNEYKSKLTTFRCYQKEAERFLLWCVSQKKKIVQLTKEDFDVYFAFLLDPQPRDFWCSCNVSRSQTDKKNDLGKGGRGKKRGHSDWRPFSGPLSLSAQQTAVTVINSMMEYLVEADYINKNPVRLIKHKQKHQKKSLEERKLKVQERVLEIDEWEAMLQTLAEMPEIDKTAEMIRTVKTSADLKDSKMVKKDKKDKKDKKNKKNGSDAKDKKYRLKLLVGMLYLLGLRISELETHRWNAFRQSNGLWWFYVIGKGDKLGKIPVNDDLLTLVKEYRLYHDLPELPDQNDQRPIIASLRTGKALTARQMNKELKQLALATAEKFENNPEKQEKLKRFSAHWLRHLSATMQDRVGVSFKHIRDNHRHANDDTTRIYVHAYDADRHADMQKLKFVLEEKK